jgi:glycosyltransferase involved in cell wall biosynthesis
LSDSQTVGTSQKAKPESSVCHTAPSATISARRVLHVLKTCLQGGVERQAAYLVAEQLRAGWQVQVVYLFPSLAEPDTAHGWFRAAGVEPRCLPPQPVPAKWGHLPRPLAEQAAMILPAIRAFQPTVVHAWIDDANVAALWAGVQSQVPAVIMTTLGLSPGRYPQVRMPWMRPLYRRGLDLPNVQLVCISDFGIRDYAEWLQVSPNRLRRIRIALPRIAPVPESQRLSLRLSLGIPPEAPVVVGIFRLEPEKRPFLFLKVMAALLHELPSLHVLHIGSGSLGHRIDAEIRRKGLQLRFHRLGRVSEPLATLAAGDVLVLTSAAEGTPNVALEAQALGVVPVLTDVGACRETLADGQTGVLVPPNDIPVIVAQVRGLLLDEARRKRLASAGPPFVAEHFGLQRFVTAFSELYEESQRAKPRYLMAEALGATLA